MKGHVLEKRPIFTCSHLKSVFKYRLLALIPQESDSKSWAGAQECALSQAPQMILRRWSMAALWGTQLNDPCWVGWGPGLLVFTCGTSLGPCPRALTETCPVRETCPAVHSRVSPIPAMVSSYTSTHTELYRPVGPAHKMLTPTHPPDLLHQSPSPASERVLVPQLK